MVERTGSFALFPVKRRPLHEKPDPRVRLGDLIAEELIDARGPQSAFIRYGRPSRIPRTERPAKR
jgi:hypothetical protein